MNPHPTRRPIRARRKPPNPPAPQPGETSPEPARPPAVRLLIVSESGVAREPVIERLRQEYPGLTVCTVSDVVLERRTTTEFGLVILCCAGSRHRDIDLLSQITKKNPSQPVIIVTNPKVAGSGPSEEVIGRESARSADEGAAAPLLVMIRDALRRPRVKRLIRVAGARGASFVARNARWLSDELQARHSIPIPASAPPFRLPIHMGESEGATPPQL